MKIKGYTKLTLQVVALSIGMMSISYIPDTEFFKDVFLFEVDGSTIYNSGDVYYKHGCTIQMCKGNTSIHYHWNYRGWVYFWTGVILFFISVIKIIHSHSEDDFKRK